MPRGQHMRQGIGKADLVFARFFAGAKLGHHVQHLDIGDDFFIAHR